MTKNGSPQITHNKNHATCAVTTQESGFSCCSPLTPFLRFSAWRRSALQEQFAKGPGTPETDLKIEINKDAQMSQNGLQLALEIVKNP